MELKLVYGNMQENEGEYRVLVYNKSQTEVKSDSGLVADYDLINGEVDEEKFVEKVNKAVNYCLENKKTAVLDLTKDSSDHYWTIYDILLDSLTEFYKSHQDDELIVKINLKTPEVSEELLEQLDKYLNINAVNTKHAYGDTYDGQKQRFNEFRKEEQFDKELDFRSYLLKLIEEKNISKNSIVYKNARISKSTFFKIVNFAEEYKPKKNTVAALAISLKLNLIEAKDFYHAAGYHLGKTELSDQIIRFYIQNKIYNVGVINECLNYYNLRGLGESPREYKKERTKNVEVNYNLKKDPLSGK